MDKKVGDSVKFDWDFRSDGNPMRLEGKIVDILSGDIVIIEVIDINMQKHVLHVPLQAIVS